MKKLLLATLFLSGLSSLFAQDIPPALMVKIEDESKPLQIRRVETEVSIHGYYAETAMTLTFYNPHNRVLEGDLYFPLPEGSTVSGYALDIEGVMIDGVVVEKEKGRVVFEKIVRQGIDPGLVEWTRGNNFKTRIFPIPAKGTRTVTVRYVSELKETEAGAVYRLPLNFKKAVSDFKLRVDVVEGQVAPSTGQKDLDGLTFVTWNRGFQAKIEKQNIILTEPLLLVLPPSERPEVVVEKGPDGAWYVALHDQQIAEADAAAAAADEIKRIALFWDASASRAKADHEKAYILIEKWMKGRNLEVDLYLVRHRVFEPQRFSIKQGVADELLIALDKTAYDGGSALANLSQAPGIDPADRILLFSDGIGNFGPTGLPAFKVPVLAFNTSAGVDAPWLRRVARNSGGRYANLREINPAQAVKLSGQTPRILQGIDSGTDAEAYPVPGSPLPSDRLDVIVRLENPVDAITLRYAEGGKEFGRKVFTITTDSASEGELLAREWAQRKLDELLIDEEKNTEAITALGKAYGLVTPLTSLIVLESVDQYVEHRIEPPPSKAEWRSAYADRVEQLAAEEKKTESDKIQAVVTMWKERVDWWEKDFNYPKDFRFTEPKAKKDRANGGDLAFAALDGALPAAPRVAAPEPASPRRVVSRLMESASISGELADEEAAEGRPGADIGRAAIAIKEADLKAPYLKPLKKAKDDALFAVYMKQRKDNAEAPAFYLDCAELLLRRGQRDLGIQVLSNLAELELESAALLRVLAYKLADIGELESALPLFETALRLRPEEPQSYRDLALLLDKMDQPARAIDLLYQVVLGHWDRFDQIETIALMELNRILAKAQAAGIKDLPWIDARLIKLLDCDIRITLTWDADLTDMDLWVIEPSGEKCFYSHNRTTIGGAMSRDFTQGYGPEEYFVKKAMPGEYEIKINYYGSSAVKLSGGVTIQAEVITNFGRKNEERKTITLRLKDAKDVVDVGVIEF